MSGLASQFLYQLGFLVLEHRGERAFVLLSPGPPWLTELWGVSPVDCERISIADKSPFLENFLYEADAFWNSNGKGVCQSETWIEKSPSGKEIPLQAIALILDGKPILALQSPEPQFRERLQLLQTARDSILEHEKLQREIQKKEILLHCIIHDLSQPLSVMSAALDCLTDEPVSVRGKDLLELGRRASDQQSSMIRDVLHVFSADLKASLDAEDKAQSFQDLLLCAQSVLSSFAPVYAAKNIRLALNRRIDKQADWHVRGEATRMGRIFSNLLENALRYAPSGSRVTIGLEPDGNFIKASVQDEGPGLPTESDPAQIFALFSKGKEGGGKAGLGLYFCRLTVERWGGSVGCVSLPGKGSRFWFRLPKPLSRTEITEKAPATAPLDGHVKSLAIKKHPMRILLADDQEDVRILTRHQLERSGHHVVTAANGQEALEALQRESFDVVLLDEEMPVMNGLQAVSAIRKLEKDSSRLILIALTGNNMDEGRLLQAGFDSVIGKPFRIEALNALFKDLSRSAQLEGQKETVFSPPETPVAHLLQRVGDDEMLARRMIAIFLRDTPKRIKAIQRSLKQKDSETLASLAHALKGTVSIFGANRAKDHLQKLQDIGRAGRFLGVAQIYKQLKEEIAELETELKGYVKNRSSPSSRVNLRAQRPSAGTRRKAT
jgi:signal transduction histidine kinase/DNA-binding response OmpR family regulator